MPAELDPTLRPWAEAVFHVLAHVRQSAPLPASLWDPRWVALVEGAAGPASARSLAEDALVLGRLLTTHEALARAQLLAWAFRDPDRALACAATDLARLDAAALDAPELLPTLAAQGAPVEILRCAALLELPVLAALPPTRRDLAGIRRALDELAPAAPGLSGRRVVLLRSLGRRGRVRGEEIWVGDPNEAGPTAEHVAWQAAHEATVAEAQQQARATVLSLSERELEHAALLLLAERAEARGLSARHRAWLAHFASTPSLVRSDAPSGVQSLVTVLLAAGGSAATRSGT